MRDAASLLPPIRGKAYCGCGCGSRDEHIPDLPEESILELAEIDVAIEDVLRSLDESLADMGIDEVDRSLIIHHVRWA